MAEALRTLIQNVELQLAYSALSHSTYDRPLDPAGNAFVKTWAPAALSQVYATISEVAAQQCTSRNLIYYPAVNSDHLVIPLLNMKVPYVIEIGDGNVVTAANYAEENYYNVSVVGDIPATANAVGDFFQDGITLVIPPRFDPVHYLPTQVFSLSVDSIASIAGQTITMQSIRQNILYGDAPPVSMEEGQRIVAGNFVDAFLYQTTADNKNKIIVRNNDVVIKFPNVLNLTNIVVSVMGRIRFYPALPEVPRNTLHSTFPFHNITQYLFLLNNAALVQRGIYLYYISPDDTRYAVEYPLFMESIKSLSEVYPSSVFTNSGPRSGL